MSGDAPDDDALVFEIHPPRGSRLPSNLEQEIRNVADRAGIDVAFDRKDTALHCVVHGNDAESRFILNMLTNAGYIVSIPG
jgi:hypothetical protein